MMEQELDYLEKERLDPKEGADGDLYVYIQVRKHELFEREEENLYFELPVSLADASLGTSIEVPNIDGSKSKVKIPAGTQSGKQLRLRDKGMPMLRGGGYGDLYLQVKVETPVSLSKEQKELLEKFKDLEDSKNNPENQSFIKKLRNFGKILINEKNQYYSYWRLRPYGVSYLLNKPKKIKN